MSNLLCEINGIGKIQGVWGDRLGTFGTVLYQALRAADIKILGIKPVGNFDNIIQVSYKGRVIKVKLTGETSAFQVVNKIISK